jgi:Ca2+-transporting ATPase
MEKELAAAMALCSDASWTATAAKGEPTECALVNYALSLGDCQTDAGKTRAARVGEAPFDSMRKMMSTVHRTERLRPVHQGRAGRVLKRCDSYRDGDGKAPPHDGGCARPRFWREQGHGGQALRVLAAPCAAGTTRRQPTRAPRRSSRICFFGLAGMIDPVRPEVKAPSRSAARRASDPS